MKKPDQFLDGIEHINVYSKGKTWLGQQLSNFAHSPIDTVDGHFESIEGYWYWLGTHDDILRDLHGYEAKKVGRAARREVEIIEVPDFQEKIKAAITVKLESDKELLKELKECSLPLKHYYCIRGIVIVPENNEWVLEHIDSFRR